MGLFNPQCTERRYSRAVGAGVTTPWPAAHERLRSTTSIERTALCIVASRGVLKFRVGHGREKTNNEAHRSMPPTNHSTQSDHCSAKPGDWAIEAARQWAFIGAKLHHERASTQPRCHTSPRPHLAAATPRRCRPACDERLEVSSSTKCLQGGRGPLGAKGQCRTFARLRYPPG